MRTPFYTVLCMLVCTTAAAQVQPAGAAPSQDDPHHGTRRFAVELTTLGLMRQKGLITQDEYDSAVRDMGDTLGAQTGDAPTLVLGRWSTTLYGFVEADSIFDSTQSFNDLAGNTQIARTGTYQSNNHRLMFGVRNSRIGFRLRAPEYHRVRASAMLEMDFLGNQPPNATEAAFFTSPTFRIRHFNLKVETPIVDVLIGQYWQLFGWQSTYQPNTVEIQGVPGEVYSRTPQIRLSKAIKTAPITFEIRCGDHASAAARLELSRGPARRAPRGQQVDRHGDHRLDGHGDSPLSFAVTARHPPLRAAPNSAADPGKSVDAQDRLGNRRRRAHSDSSGPSEQEGQRAHGQRRIRVRLRHRRSVHEPQRRRVVPDAAQPDDGDAGAEPIRPTSIRASPSSPPTASTVDLIQWQSYLFGAQYYLPGLKGRGWVSANYSHMDSKNSSSHGAATKVRFKEDWADVNLFGDVTPAVRLGLEYAWFRDQYVDGNAPVNHRVQFSAFYLF